MPSADQHSGKSSALALLFNESVEQVRERERTALDALLDQRKRRVVLMGAGTLGRRALLLLREIGADVVAFTDNNRSVWGSEIQNTPVVSPEEAASRYGNSALFLVTIWNDRHWFRESWEQMTNLGCTLVSSYAPLFWRFPDRFLQLVLLNDLPHKVYEDTQAVLDAEQLWEDDESLRIYRANIRWRALGDPLDLPGRPLQNTYFPQDLFRLNAKDAILDCGAYDGDTIRQALDSAGDSICSIDAIEADAISFARLKHFVETLPPELQQRIRLHPCALGEKRGQIRFECSGSVDSKASDTGVMVDVVPMDELLLDRRCTFVKMDIEGAELDTLRGGRKVIERDRPILAICVYHTQNDIWRIPLLVREMLPEHHLYLRGYEGDGFQTVLYAISPERDV